MSRPKITEKIGSIPQREFESHFSAEENRETQRAAELFIEISKEHTNLDPDRVWDAVWKQIESEETRMQGRTLPGRRAASI